MHYINNLGAGGAEKLLVDILPLMKAKGHDVHLIYSNNKANVEKYDTLLKNANIYVRNLKVSFYNPLQILTLIRIMMREQYDIVHAHLFPTQYWLAFASIFKPYKTRLIKTEHSVFNERKQYKILKPLDGFVYSKYNTVIGITNQVTDNLQNWVGKNIKLVTIENGVNLEQIRSAQQLNAKNDYSFFNNDKFKILMVGRFDGKHKDQLTLIKSLNYLPNNIHLYFAGNGPALERIKKEVYTLGLKSKVDFLGMRDDVYVLMKMVDLNVLSTNTEGLSGVTLESLASGKPFIGSDVEGVNNVVPDESFLFPNQNPEKLAAKIQEIMQNPTFRQELIIKAKQFIGNYDILKMVENYLLAYESHFE